MTLDIRLSTSCGSCRFFKGSRKKDGGECHHPALDAPRETGKLGVCDGYELSERMARTVQRNRICDHASTTDYLKAKLKSVTADGAGKISFALSVRCSTCGKFLGHKVRHLYEFVLDRRHPNKPVMTTKYDEEYVWTARRYKKFVRGKPVPVYTPKEEGPR